MSNKIARIPKLIDNGKWGINKSSAHDSLHIEHFELLLLFFFSNIAPCIYSSPRDIFPAPLMLSKIYTSGFVVIHTFCRVAHVCESDGDVVADSAISVVIYNRSRIYSAGWLLNDDAASAICGNNVCYVDTMKNVLRPARFPLSLLLLLPFPSAPRPRAITRREPFRNDISGTILICINETNGRDLRRNRVSGAINAQRGRLERNRAAKCRRRWKNNFE